MVFVGFRPDVPHVNVAVAAGGAVLADARHAAAAQCRDAASALGDARRSVGFW